MKGWGAIAALLTGLLVATPLAAQGPRIEPPAGLDVPGIGDEGVGGPAVDGRRVVLAHEAGRRVGGVAIA